MQNYNSCANLKRQLAGVGTGVRSDGTLD